MRPALVLTGLFFLFIGSYLDNSRGPLLPEITHALNMHYSESSWFFIAGNIGSVLATFLLIPLAHAFSERALAFGVCIFGLVSLVLSRTVTDFPTLILFSTGIGCTVALFGALSNLLVIEGSDSERRSHFFCILHMMYGLGSLLAPVIVSKLLGRNLGWTSPILILVPVFLIYGAVTLRVLPKREKSHVKIKQSSKLNFIQIFIIVTFALYVIGEVLTSMWLVAFLMEGRHYTLEEASPYLTGFFVMMALTRGLIFISLKPKYEKAVIVGSLVLGTVFFYLGINGWILGFSLVGVVGPFFPLLLARVGKVFPLQSRPLTLWILGVNQLSLAVFHIVTGKLTDRFGVGISYQLPGIFLILAVVVSAFYFRLEKNAKGS